MVLLLVNIGNSKPIYDATQLRSILDSHCKMIPGFPEILGIHIYCLLYTSPSPRD